MKAEEFKASVMKHIGNWSKGIIGEIFDKNPQLSKVLSKYMKRGAVNMIQEYNDVLEKNVDKVILFIKDEKTGEVDPDEAFNDLMLIVKESPKSEFNLGNGIIATIGGGTLGSIGMNNGLTRFLTGGTINMITMSESDILSLKDLIVKG